MPCAPKRSQANAAAKTFGTFPPLELRRVAILLMLTDNLVMLFELNNTKIIKCRGEKFFEPTYFFLNCIRMDSLFSFGTGFGWKDFFDVLLVSIIIYYIYSLIKGTIAVNILLGVFLFYGIYLVVKQLEMRLLTEIFGGFISVGSIALIVVFQQEIRRFLLHIGKNISIRRKKFFWTFLGAK